MLERLLTRFVERLADRAGDSLDRAIPTAAQAFGARLADRFADNVQAPNAEGTVKVGALESVVDVLGKLVGRNLR
ncbi:hypothetical protein [Mycobacteroides abscessus]|uniref:hypothetical protein n=1 Tax=Mycobacteroides abscessus TaxID=36809 RepID=UPI0018776338|nr:hypothetical protein [Mycobacteroides abscessus]